MSRPVAVITGASRGIGRALVERLTAHDHTVVAIARSQDSLAELSERTGSLSYALDVASPPAVQQAFSRILSEVGVPDLLVNNAGISGGSAKTWELPAEDWWHVCEVNLRGTYLCTRAVLEPMMARGRGRVVNVSSGAAYYPTWEENDGVINSAYMASKAAVIRFSEAVAGECASADVRVFSMSPGMVKTEMTAGPFAGQWDQPEAWTPIERSLDLVEDVASGRLDALSGRYLRAGVDDWRALADRAHAVNEADTHTLRVRL